MTHPDYKEAAALRGADLLSGPFAARTGPEMSTPPAVTALAAGQVRALLESAPSFYQLPEATRIRMREDLERISGYTAALVHEGWSQSARLGQTPVVRERRVVEGEMTQGGASRAEAQQSRASRAVSARAQSTPPPPAPGYPARSAGGSITPPGGLPRRSGPARTLADGFQANEDGGFDPVAASNVARITEDTLNAIAFPTFVADLIKGTFQAIVDSSIQQMEAYAELLANVSKSVSDFEKDNITDNNARDWLAGAYPQVIRVDTSSGQPRLAPAPGADNAQPPDFRRDLNLGEEVGVDAESFEALLVPAARRRIAESRQQTLATMVLMGMNRIVVTRGRIRAGMGFRIDTTDTSRSQSAQRFDTRTEAQARYGWFLSPVKVSAKTSVAYVSSSQKNSESEIDVSANLTGEVDLQFKSDYFPLERFADAGMIGSIQQNTPNPGANKPITGAGATSGT